MQANSVRIFEFGPFRLISSECRLFKNGHPLALPPKVFDTLVVLVENRGRLVDKREIMNRVWPDSYVEEVNLSRSISSLRRALGESATESAYIETVPKSGYRFVATVVELETDQASVILEKYTSSEIITEESEEIDSSVGLRSDSFKARSASILASRHKWVWLALGLILFASLFAYARLRGSSASGDGILIKSLAVLPFKSIDNGGDDLHQGLGMTDLLITRLSNIGYLRVRPTSAILAFEKKVKDSIDIGQRMNVNAVLEGTIYRTGDKVRVTARLIRVSDQSSLWAGQFEKLAHDELRLQDEIALQVVDALVVNLGANEKNAVTKR